MKTFFKITRKFFCIFSIILVIVNAENIYKFIRSTSSSHDLVNAINTVSSPKMDYDKVINYAQGVANGEESLVDDFDKGVLSLIDDTNSAVSNVTIDNSQNDNQSVTKELEAVTVNRIVDGDTIVVEDNKGESTKVRLIGVNSPESDTAAGEKATEYTAAKLKKGTVVYLQYDSSKLDKYDRTLAYVWLNNNVDVSNTDDIIDYMYNAILLMDGQADVMTVEPNVMYQSVFEKLQEIRDSNS